MKRTCAFAAILLAATMLLAACGPAAVVDEKLLTLVSNGESDWCIIVPRSASQKEVEAAELLRDTVAEKCGVTLGISDDYVNEKRGIFVGEHEILVGNTSRDESREVRRRLRIGDREIAVCGGKPVILGGSDELTLLAAQTLADSLKFEEDGSLAIYASQCVAAAGEYEVDTVCVDGLSLLGMPIVYPIGSAQGKAIAEDLSDRLCAVAGLLPECVSSENAADGILLELRGDGSGETYITVEDPCIKIEADDIPSLRYAVTLLCDEVFVADAAKDGRLDISLDGRVIKDTSGGLSVMSFNILYDLGSDTSRADKVIATVLERMPDSVGFQEVTEKWLELLAAGLGAYYDWAGEINDEYGQRWRNAIFYRRDKFEMVSTETRWLSGTPTKRSKLASSSQYRIYTAVRLRCIDSGREWVHVNTHLSFDTDAREPQVNILLRELQKLDAPFVLTGDFNFSPETEYYSMMTSGGVSDAKYLASHRENKNTCGSNVIDYCFLSDGDFNVRAYYVEDKVICSDHRAVYVEFSFLHTK